MLQQLCQGRDGAQRIARDRKTQVLPAPSFSAQLAARLFLASGMALTRLCPCPQRWQPLHKAVHLSPLWPQSPDWRTKWIQRLSLVYSWMFSWTCKLQVFVLPSTELLTCGFAVCLSWSWAPVTAGNYSHSQSSHCTSGHLLRPVLVLCACEQSYWSDQALLALLALLMFSKGCLGMIQNFYIMSVPESQEKSLHCIFQPFA